MNKQLAATDRAFQSKIEQASKKSRELSQTYYKRIVTVYKVI